jgi:hypothetical protein
MLINLPNSSNPEPDQELVAELQRLLADARVGKLQGFAAIYYTSSEEGFLALSSVVSGVALAAEITTVGALNSLATSISMTAVREGD